MLLVDPSAVLEASADRLSCRLRRTTGGAGFVCVSVSLSLSLSLFVKQAQAGLLMNRAWSGDDLWIVCIFCGENSPQA